MQSFGVLFTITFVSIASATHWIAYRWATTSFAPLLRYRRAIIAACATCVLLQPVTRAWMHQGHAPVAAWLHVADLFEIMTVGLAAVPLGLILLARRRARQAAAPAPAPLPAVGPSRREALEQLAGVGVLGGAASVLGWGAVFGRHELEVTEVPVKIAGLPKALDGYVIAQVSDIHAGLFVAERDLAEGIGRIAKLRPDLVVATGDLVDFDPSYARLVARKLADLAPRDGVAAILGNHDYYAGAAHIAAALREAGVDVLTNRGKMLREGDGGGFALLGVDDLWAYRYGAPGPQLDRAIASVRPDAPRILLSHQPQSVDMWRGKVALQLSGHTHGGQINPGFRPAALFLPYLAGRYDLGATTLYVNRGFGTAGPPSRVGAPPEITKIVLVAA